MLSIIDVVNAFGLPFILYAIFCCIPSFIASFGIIHVYQALPFIVLIGTSCVVKLYANIELPNESTPPEDCGTV